MFEDFSNLAMGLEIKLHFELFDQNLKINPTVSLKRVLIPHFINPRLEEEEEIKEQLLIYSRKSKKIVLSISRKIS